MSKKKDKIFSFSTSNLITDIIIPPLNIIQPEPFLQYDLADSANNNELAIEEKGFIKLLLTKNVLNKKLPKPENALPTKNKKKQINPLVGLTMNLTYNTSPAKCLSIPFKVNSVGNIDCYLSSITIDSEGNGKTFGLITPFKLLINIPFTIMNHTTHQKEYVVIEKSQETSLSFVDFKLATIFHMKMCYDCYLKKELKEEDVDKGIERLFNSTSKEKKYLFVPVCFDSFGLMTIDLIKLQHCANIFHANNSNSNNVQTLESIILDYFNNHMRDEGLTVPSESFQKELLQHLSEYLFVTQYRNWNVYEIFDLLFSKETFTVFIDKLSCHKKDYSERILNKYFSEVKAMNNYDSITTEDIMTKLPTKAHSVTGYRQLESKYNIKINQSPICYGYGKKNYFIFDSYIYNRVFDKNTLKTSHEEQKDIVHSIFPIDIMLQFYLTKEEVEIVYKLPSIFTVFESMLIPYEFIFDLGCFDISSIDISYENYQYFLWCFTTPSSLMFYDYETLETLGDSILKILTTTTLFYNDNLHQLKLLAGQMEKNRQYFISNKHLFKKGRAGEIYRYILGLDLHKVEYEFPLKVLSDLEFHITITEKTMADVVEATLGAIFLFSNDIRHCYHFIKKIGILNNYHTEEDIKDIKEDSWASAITDDKVFEYVNRTLNISSYKYPEIEMIPADITILQLLELHGGKFIKEISTIEDLQAKCIQYRFKDENLLIKALTHKTINNSPNKNYETLEFLGDSIVESFISCSLFKIFAPYLYPSSSDEIANENIDELTSIKQTKGKIFNNVYMTHIKSLLCSNAFMCNLSCYLHLAEFFICEKTSIRSKTDDFITASNIETLFNRKLNDYESTKAVTPKIIADLFEAVVGAIYIDSDLNTVYDFLYRLYSPFISYCALYFDVLKYSVVNDFTILAENEIKSAPTFTQEIDNEGLYHVSILLNGEKLCTGIGSDAEIAKQQAAMIGIKKIKFNID